MSTISRISARQIFDSRGFPSVEVDVWLDSGVLGRAAVPSGASTGRHEAVELRDGGSESGGKGVSKAVNGIIKEISPALTGFSVADQRAIDGCLISLDGTENKSRLGANSILGVSLACARAAAAEQGVPLYTYLGGIRGGTLPVPFVNVINGGAHADNALDFQEIMIVPVGANSFGEAICRCASVFHALKARLQDDGLSTGLGDEGGFAPEFDSAEKALDTLSLAIEDAGFRVGADIAFALDCAASELLSEQGYSFRGGDEVLDVEGMVGLFSGLCNRYPIVSIEDPLAEDDWSGWKQLTDAIGDRVQLVGDDLFVTQSSRLRDGAGIGAANAILIKLNQIGTLSETLVTMELAGKLGYGAMVSHRSGETEDTFIADLSVATNCGMIKTGSTARSERTAKYNALLRIEEALGASANLAPLPRVCRSNIG